MPNLTPPTPPTNIPPSVAGAGIGRTYYLIKLGKTYDTSWTGFDLLIWTIIELQLGIICSCAPSLRAFFRRYLSEFFSRTFGSTNTNTTSKSKSKSTKDRHTTEPSYGAHEHHSPRGESRESIDMQVLTGRGFSSDSECAGAEGSVPPVPSGHVRSVSPARTHISLSARGDSDGREVRRWSTSCSTQVSSKQGAQETHSAV